MSKIDELRKRIGLDTRRSVADLITGQKVICSGGARWATEDEMGKIKEFLNKGKTPLSLMQQRDSGMGK